ncbi:stalk domain-containing protein [Herbivorax sp. ANBcel31]|uniref:stalk domain-containing protein n=1 Tax=Herbivorax sp. ANBcel31 TaxID=3069754 RepID=UPI0027B10984|nr:stalk domain-containing protein [Herbivorax sp. ANBcel31]MDQ2085045.1 stalk domain-containing protein [Herbivorax sp. ANBcel31]
MKKISFLTTAILIMMTVFATTISAQAPIDIMLNGESINFPDAKPFIDGNGRTQVPVRFITEALGASVKWDGSTKTVTITLDNKKIEIVIGRRSYTVNRRKRQMDTAAVLKGDRTFVPVRFIGEEFGARVNWDSLYRMVYINTIKEHEDSGNEKIESNVDYQTEMLNLVNGIRESAGLNPLEYDSALGAAAQVRSDELPSSFSHTRPDGTSCFTVLKEYSVSYRTCAENIAAGKSEPSEVIEQWMNSEGHRKNILNPSFEKMAIGYTESNEGYRHYWVQLFTG